MYNKEHRYGDIKAQKGTIAAAQMQRPGIWI